MSRKVQFVVTYNMGEAGSIDLDLLESRLIATFQQAQDLVQLTPEGEEFAEVIDIDVMPRGRVE